MSHKVCTIIMTCGRTHFLVKCLDAALRHKLITKEQPAYICRTVDYIDHEIQVVQMYEWRYAGMIFDRHFGHSKGSLHGWKALLDTIPQYDIVIKLDDDVWISSDGIPERAIERLDLDQKLVSVQPVMPISCQGSQLIIDALALRSDANALDQWLEEHPMISQRTNPYKGWNFPASSFRHQEWLWEASIKSIQSTLEALRSYYESPWIPVDKWFQIGIAVMKRSWVDDVFKRRQGADERIMNQDLGMDLDFQKRSDPEAALYRAEIDAHSLAIHFSYHQYHAQMLSGHWQDVCHKNL